MKQLLNNLWTKVNAVILYPVAVFIVTSHSLWEFTRLWIKGYAIENIFQILFVDLQHNVQKLIKRSARLAPVFYFVLLYLIFGSLAAIWNFFVGILK
jgi:hypothetical protein